MRSYHLGRVLDLSTVPVNDYAWEEKEFPCTDAQDCCWCPPSPPQSALRLRVPASRSGNKNCHPGGIRRGHSDLRLQAGQTPGPRCLPISRQAFHGARGNQTRADGQERSNPCMQPTTKTDLLNLSLSLSSNLSIFLTSIYWPR